MNRYFLKYKLGDQKVEREVSVEEFCNAERSVGFWPKMPSTHPDYLRTPATGGFSGGGISGRTEYAPDT